MATSATKLSNPSSNLVVDSTSHLPELINVSTSPTILDGTTITNGTSVNELINTDNVNEMNIQIEFIIYFKAQSNSSSSHSPQSTSTNGTSSTHASTTSGTIQKRLHVSNIPFRFRDEDLKAMFEVQDRFHLSHMLSFF